MKLLIAALLYTGLSLGANTAMADIAQAEAARSGDMRKLIFHTSPVAVTKAPFQLADGAGEGQLADYAGKVVLVNFWATWCAPCRKEMPMLSALQTAYGGDDFEVLTLATGRNSAAGITNFLSGAGITNLPRHQDPKQAVAAQMGVFGLPITVILGRDGREIARLRGDADWSSDSAKAVIEALIKTDGD